VREILVALGQRIRGLRKRKGFSQEAFADVTGVHRTWMGAVERGERNLSFHNLVLVSKALGITLSQLLSGVEKQAEELRDGRRETQTSGGKEERAEEPKPPRHR
jgi:transcriptional regulator with XRE-family HTH domain